MSGPKYYTFPMKSAEEAAETFARISNMRGVTISVENDKIRCVVSSSAWYGGVTLESIKQCVDKARDNYLQNERMKKLVNDKKNEEKDKINRKKEQLELSLKKEQANLSQEASTCERIIKEMGKKISTRFGMFGLSNDSSKADEILDKIEKFKKLLSDEKKKAVAVCDQCLTELESCNDLRTISEISNRYNRAKISQYSLDKEIADLKKEKNEKANILQNFANCLNKLYSELQEQGLTGYYEMIKAKVQGIDILDGNASKTISEILNEIKREIESMKDYVKERDENARTAADFQSIIESVSSLSGLLQSSETILDGERRVVEDFTQKSKSKLNDCKEKVSAIEKLDFLSDVNKQKLDKLNCDLQRLANSLRYQSTAQELSVLCGKLTQLEKSCKSENDIVARFKAEQDRYIELYVKLQGLLSIEDVTFSAGAQDYIVDPAENVLSDKNPEEQIQKLHELNEQLSVELGKLLQENICSLFSDTLSAAAGTIGKEFKKEKENDGLMHLTYVRPNSKGAIFDLSCTVQGDVSVYPRGVILHNGKKLINNEELEKIHASCEWAEQFTSNLKKCGLEEIEYGEMADEYKQSLYREENYYHLNSLDESRKYLEMMGYTEEEILGLLGEQTGGQSSQSKRKIQYSEIDPKKK